VKTVSDEQLCAGYWLPEFSTKQKNATVAAGNQACGGLNTFPQKPEACCQSARWREGDADATSRFDH
jgi:hypothetical protein